MDAMKRLALAFAATALLPGLATAQNPAERVRVIRAEPLADSVPFGAPFDLEVIVEAEPGISLLLPDTLDTAETMYSVGAGSWQGEIAGDTARVRLVYPVIAFQDGIHELPELTLGFASAAGASERWMPLSTVTGGLDAALTMVTLPLGSATILEHPAFSSGQEVIDFTPQPPADVAGGTWSVWLMLAVGFATMAGVGGLGGFIPRWWSDSGADALARLRGRDPRGTALAELEKLRAVGLHREGRMHEFYASATEILRVYIARTRDDLDRSRTMTELAATLRASPSPRDASLLGALATAERTIFGLTRPDAVTAESDWKAMHDWIDGQEA